MTLPDWWPSVTPHIIGDSLEIMPTFQDKSVDLILTDPPYNAKNIGPNERTYSYGPMQLPEKEYQKFCMDWFKEAMRLTNTLVFTPGIGNICNYPQPHWVICWHKPASVSFNRMGGYNAWEPIFIYGKPAKGKHLGQDYVLCNTTSSKKGIEGEHPCPKPLELWELLIEKFSNEGDVVYDPFLGAGTTLLACRRKDRIGIGSEINPGYERIILGYSMQKITKVDDERWIV